jgi:hypothetical protein
LFAFDVAGVGHVWTGSANATDAAFYQNVEFLVEMRGQSKHMGVEAAKKARQDGENDLVPYWIYPIDGGARIERYVPSLPLTRDRQLIEALRRSLAVYRLVFGQPRQDDLLKYLLQHVPKDRLDELVGRLKINLSP